MIIDEKAIREAVEGGTRLQKIQVIVWNYMALPQHERNGVEMAMEIDNLYKEKNNESA